MTETQERFLRTVLGRVPLESVVELHLFPPIRRGTLETGVAVIATRIPQAPALVQDEDEDAEKDAPESVSAEITVEGDGEIDAPVIADADLPTNDVAEPREVVTASSRTRILTAAYRHTIKGVDRGKWGVDILEEADAPLDAVEAVLRGVRHRSTEAADPELITYSELHALQQSVAVAPAA
jgi:hypothetical protein